MTEQDNFGAAVKQMGVREHLDLYIRPGLGSKGLYWGSRGREGALPTQTWRSLRETALATDHAKFSAADLDGLMAGQAFLERVIRDPKVQATGKWLCLERPEFREMFTEGKFPTQTRSVQRRPRRTNLPVRANIGHAAEMKQHWDRLPSQPVQHSGYSFSEPTSIVRTWDRKWPVVLDATDLTEIFGAEYDANANYRHAPFEGPIHHAAQALADRHHAFFDLLRARLLVADGTFKGTGQEAPIPDKQWHRQDRYLDVQSNDLSNKERESANAVWESVTLRLPRQEAIAGGSSRVALPHPTSASPPPLSAEEDASALRPLRKRGRRTKVASRVEEAMKRDINEGRRTPEGLANMLEKHMEAQYSASRDSCRKARRKVLSEIILDK